MSTSFGRRLRLRFVKKLPATKCPGCGTSLERVPIVSVHLKRCDRRLARAQAELDRALVQQ